MRFMNDRAEITRLDRSWNRAYQTVDMVLLSSLLADDWFGVLASDEAISKQTLLESMPNNPASMLEFADFEISIFESTAVTRGSLTVTSAGFRVQQRFMRVWAKRSGNWQSVAVQVSAM